VAADKLKPQGGTMLLLRVGMFGAVSWNYSLFLRFSFLMLSASKNFGIDSATTNCYIIFFIMNSATRSSWDSWPLSDAVAATGGDALAKR